MQEQVTHDEMVAAVRERIRQIATGGDAETVSRELAPMCAVLIVLERQERMEAVVEAARGAWAAFRRDELLPEGYWSPSGRMTAGMEPMRDALDALADKAWPRLLLCARTGARVCPP